MDTVADVTFAGHQTSLGRTTRAQGQDEVGVLVANHGTGVVWSIVCGSAHALASRAVDDNASWVVGIVLHRGDDPHTTSGEGIAVDVGQIIIDLAAGPGELELRDWSRGGGIRGKLDGDTHTLLAVLFGEAALELLHVGSVALTNRRVVDRESAVVDDGSSSQSQGGRGRGKQHGCASENVLVLHFGCWFPFGRIVKSRGLVVMGMDQKGMVLCTESRRQRFFQQRNDADQRPARG